MNSKNQIDRPILLKGLLIISFMLFSIVTLFISQYSSNGYNLSIYNNLPFPSVVILSVLVLVGILVTLNCYKKENTLWKLGLLLVILCNFVILLLPYLTGYTYSSNSDHLTHIGFIKDILNTSNLNSYLDKNIYPLTHILVVEIKLFTKLSVEKIAFFIGPLFYLLFLFYTYIFSRKLTPKSKIFAILASTVLFCYFFKEIFPMGFAFLTYPLIFYVYYNYHTKKNISYAILTLILLGIMPFFHPIAAIFIPFILLIFEIVNHYINIIFLKNKYHKISFTLIFFSLIIVTMWMWQITWLWKTSVLNVVNFLNFDLLSQPFVNKASESFNKLGLNNIQILELFIRIYGSIALFSILAMISALKIIINKEVTSNKNRFMYFLSFVFLFCSLLWILDYVHPLTGLTSGRIIWLVIPLFPIFVGISLYKIFNSNFLSEKNSFIIVFLMISLSSLIAMYSIYPSPQIYQFNTAVSPSEIDGAKWFISNSNGTGSALTLGYVPIYRYENAIEGTSLTKMDRANLNGINDHFNYTKSSAIGDNYNKNEYLVIRENFLISIYTSIYKNLQKFNAEDFNKLNSDPTVSQIYENGNINILFIRPVESL